MNSIRNNPDGEEAQRMERQHRSYVGGLKLAAAQRDYDNTSPPDDSADCDIQGHFRSRGIPLMDGKATCRDCGELFDEADDRKRIEDLRKKEFEAEGERRFEALADRKAFGI